MEVINEKIVKATESELFSYYLTRGWDDMMSFPDYLRQVKENGTVVTEGESSKEPERESFASKLNKQLEMHDRLMGYGKFQKYKCQ